MPRPDSSYKINPTREKLHEIIFEADTRSGKIFNIALLSAITLSIVVVMLESMNRLQVRYADLFFWLEWMFTVVFTIEYVLRLYAVYRPLKYATSFFGIVDLLAILPAYLSLIITGSQYFLVIRVLRLMRIFRIFKLARFLREGNTILNAMRASMAKITFFLVVVLLMVIIIGSFMYLLEGGQNDSFSSIPRSIYWAIVTLTTVGYGDITPITSLGQFFSAIVMLLGYAIIAVPTGIVSGELIRADQEKKTYDTTQACRFCGRGGHDADASYCNHCGALLNEEEGPHKD